MCTKTYNRFIEWLNSIKADYIYHFIAGVLISALFALAFHWKASIVPALIAGAIKELIDEGRYHGADDLDFAATFLGGFVVQAFGGIGLLIPAL